MKSSSKNAKILQVSSSYHFGSDGSDLGTSNSSSGAPIASQPGGSHGFLIFRSQRKYANSKLSQILHARALQRRHEEISAVSVCPAWVGTQIGGNKGSLIHFLLSKVAFPVNGYGLSSILHALFDEESSSRGDYYVNVDLGIPIVMDYMPSWTYSALPFWDIATSIYSACLFHVQRLFVVKTTRPSSFVSYNEQLQEELYNWSKTAVSQWL